MKSASIFQILVLGIFGFGLVVSVLIFAGIIPGFGGGRGGGPKAELILWGSVPEEDIRELVLSTSEKSDVFSLKYIWIPADNFENKLIGALARNEGPDLVILPPELIVSQDDKFYKIPYESIPARTFKETFLDIGSVYLKDSGIVALPLAVDPLVMYYNPTMFTNAGIVEMPQTWTEFFVAQPKLTKVDMLTGQVYQSAISFGEFSNVTNAKEILLTLINQSSGEMVSRSADSYTVNINKDNKDKLLSMVAGVNFFTQFSDPSKSTYSWNRSLNQDRDAFLAGTLATYFGFASEAKILKARNPNLKFAVLPVPQRERDGTKSVYGRVYGVAILNSSINLPASYSAVTTLVSSEVALDWIKSLDSVPVRRDLFVREATDADPDKSVFYESALASHSFLDPNSIETKNIFSSMIQDINNRRSNTESALVRVGSQLTTLFGSLKKN